MAIQPRLRFEQIPTATAEKIAEQERKLIELSKRKPARKSATWKAGDAK